MGLRAPDIARSTGWRNHSRGRAWTKGRETRRDERTSQPSRELSTCLSETDLLDLEQTVVEGEGDHLTQQKRQGQRADRGSSRAVTRKQEGPSETALL